MKIATAFAGLLCIVCLMGHARGAEDETPEDDFKTKITGYKTRYDVVKEGEAGADYVQKGNTVTVHATGTVQQTGKQFWSTKDTNSPFTYNAGVGKVITGWDQGCLGMKVGEIRKLLIPADEGYGAGGFPSWGIPPNGILVFEIEVLNIK